VPLWFFGCSINFTGFFVFELGPPRFGGAIDWAMDANGRSGREGGKDDVRIGCGLGAEGECFRDDEGARGDETNDVERESNGEW
jgi:hypothetical protein